MNTPHFLAVCLNPVLQKTILLKQLWENEVNRSEEYYFDASGKGANVARVLNQLDEKVVFLTQAGGINRELFLSMIKKEDINCKWVDSKSEIRYCYTLLNQNLNTTTEIVEEAKTVNINTEKKILILFKKLIKNTRTLIISGTKSAGFSDDLYPEMVFYAKKNKINVILDIKGDDLVNCLVYKPDIIKPNLSEFIATFYKNLKTKEHEHNDEILNHAKEKMIEISEKYGSITILTRGKYGAIFIKDNELISIPAEQIKTINTTGCGDAFTAGFASEWNKSCDIEKSIINGMFCAKKNAQLIRPGIISGRDK